MVDRRKKKVAVRSRLTRTLVLDAALRLIDAEGVEALTMRRLAAELGVEAMSLYNHVKDKQALLGGVMDRAAAEFVPPADVGGDWKRWVRSWLVNVRRVLARHPQLFRVLLVGHPPLGPNMLKLIESCLGRLHAAGFDEETQARVWDVLQAYLFGSLWVEKIRPGDISPTDFVACCPNVVRLMSSQHRPDHERVFAYGLDVLLAGLDRVGTRPPG